MNSRIYTGHIRHMRYRPVKNSFRYRIFLMYLDLGELDQVFRGRLLWSAKKMNLAFLRRKDHFGDPRITIEDSVRLLVEEKTGKRPEGAIRMLTHLRYFGHCFNPATFYYCFDEGGEQVETIVLEVHNTPWGEVHCYVIPCSENNSDGKSWRFALAKEFHVSPFLPMDIDYEWSFTPPGEQLQVLMVDYHENKRIFEAELELSQLPITGGSLRRMLVVYPLMTMKVTAGIYWQALRLWLRGAQFYSHP
ncbi:DUF1365 domain-containing protein [Desulfosediminicola ganghwensis]|uniref:DUF1365 domain-containing protein n=1 Tax=Desulfosediminicola ganghwensis TaxID=2569540 RepID=UPI0010AC98CF|nr:DUF1365 domain-containing protein [Desulfosediminicola ganghwensis]